MSKTRSKVMTIANTLVALSILTLISTSRGFSAEKLIAYCNDNNITRAEAIRHGIHLLLEKK